MKLITRLSRLVDRKYKSAFRWILENIVHYLSILIRKLNNTDNVTKLTGLNSLAPVENADEDGKYSQVLEWALSRRKQDIKNIAITGPYGSGKSSILRSFQRNYKGNELNFLNISLATFSEDLKELKPNERDKLLRLIELSILQQIFYHKEDRKIPDSRFKKIKNFKKIELYAKSFGLFLFCLSLFNLIFAEFVANIVLTEFPGVLTTMKIVPFISLSIVVCGISIIAYKSIRVLHNFTISKLNINNAEIQIDPKIEKSILNHHLDEIIYFFEKTNYNVVIIEDLDRFEQTEIFSKFREINFLLNNSEKTKDKGIVFVYAIRDDMFNDDKNRAKFFDFILPVIPVINTSNSSQKLSEISRVNHLNLTDDFIENISFFIDDMRLLYGTVNEFVIYNDKLGQYLNSNKLFAILLYKNLFPDDFSSLGNNKGELFSALDAKNKHIDSVILSIEKEIENLKTEVQNLGLITIRNTSELRRLYVLKYIENIPYFTSFQVNGNDITIEQSVNDENFAYFVQNSMQVNVYSRPNLRTGIPLRFNEIEKLVDSISYLDRKNLLDNLTSNRINSVTSKIQKLEKEKLATRNNSIQELLLKSLVEIDTKNEKQKKIINFFLRNGYIDDNYYDYISIFYPESITLQDQSFLLNVRSKILTSFDYKLIKTDKLIGKINLAVFASEFVLNYNLVDYVLKHQKLNSQRELIFEKLSDESEISFKFVEGFLDNGKNLKEFIKNLCRKWPNYWHFIESSPELLDTRKDYYFNLLIEYGDVKDIKKISDQSNLKDIILREKDFLSKFENVNQIINIIKSLTLSFAFVDLTKAHQELFDYVYQNNLYDLNLDMVKEIVKRKASFNQAEFDTKNYTFINNSNCSELIEYINANINTYIENVYSKISSNKYDDEKNLVDLLNSDEITFENATVVIKQNENKFSSIEEIIELEIVDLLITELKVVPTWKNIIEFYKLKEDAFTDSLLNFINNEDNAKELSKSMIPIPEVDKEVIKTFINNLVLNNTLNNSSYNFIIKSVPYVYERIDITVLSTDKVKILLENSKLSFNTENYEMIKSAQKTLLIIFIEMNKYRFLSNIDNFEKDNEVILSITLSNIFIPKEKQTVIKKADEEGLSLNNEIYKQIGLLLTSSLTNNLSPTLIAKVLTSISVSRTLRIKIFNMYHAVLQIDTYKDFLKSLGSPYSGINQKRSNPLLENTRENLRMIEILKFKEFFSKFEKDKAGIRIYNFKHPRV